MAVACVHEEGADCMAHPSRVHALRGETALHFRHIHACIQWQLIPPVAAKKWRDATRGFFNVSYRWLAHALV